MNKQNVVEYMRKLKDDSVRANVITRRRADQALYSFSKTTDIFKVELHVSISNNAYGWYAFMTFKDTPPSSTAKIYFETLMRRIQSDLAEFGLAVTFTSNVYEPGEYYDNIEIWSINFTL